jgi:hypothetical protein
MFSDSIMSTPRMCPHCPNNAGEKACQPQAKFEKRFVKASRLFSITETHTARISASQENSAAIAETLNDIPRNSAVSFLLLLGDPKRNIPSILLDTVGDMVPTIHRDSWIALDRPTWTGGEVYMSAKKYRKIPEHKCNPPCNMCVRAARMNAGAQLILGGGTTGLEEEEDDSEDD